jgi:hypothetical protein
MRYREDLKEFLDFPFGFDPTGSQPNALVAKHMHQLFRV